MPPEPSVETSLALIRQSLKAQDGVLEKLDHSVNGNGKIGLTRRVDLIEGFINTLKRVGWIIAGALVAELVAGTIAAVVWIIRAMGH